ncbi:MAG: phosphate/phosphite/phosphonate ABC transporter substrate-binding protein [Ectothiorhodospiraceae bacterium]|nr:phosphate/phosphite/phosphonate ABC transporter substrate-binding protein [Ectothiorhodospiraceae bacterium]
MLRQYTNYFYCLCGTRPPRRRARTLLILFAVLLTFLATGLPSTTVAESADKQYTLGVFPYLPPARIEKLYGPFAASLSEAIKRPALLRSRSSFEEFRRAASNGKFDIIFIQPFDYIRLGKNTPYQAIARWQSQLHAIFVTLPSSPIKHLKELKGQVIAMPDIDAAVSLLGYLTLHQANLILGTDVKIVHTANHFACMKLLLIGKAAACVTAPSPRRLFQDRAKLTLKLITKSQNIPSPLYAVHSRLPAKHHQAIFDTVIGWGNTEKGRRLLSSVKFKAYVPTTSKEYEPVRVIWKEVQPLIQQYQVQQHKGSQNPSSPQ